MQYKYDNYASIQYRDIMGPSGSFIKQRVIKHTPGDIEM